MIPKKIHFCWYGRGKYNNTIEKCIASWEKKLPEYEIKKWDETNTPFDKLPFLKLLYKQKKWSFITDYIRLYSIYSEGGIYLDTDVEILKPFGKLLEESAFLGFQTNSIKSKYPLNSAVIGSVKQNPFILDCIKATETKQRLNFNAMGGPPIVSQIIKSYGLKNNNLQHLNKVLLLPFNYFYPFSWEDTFTPECITENTICIHWWEDSWQNKKRGIPYYLESTKRKLEKTPLIIANRLKYTFNKDEFYLIDKLIK
ncbi:glycosyltransferase family 32 protein [Siansivirga zeaxanthinifaciens]|uniref:Glycosyltransferase n=1 Tax=Siansivirga zeaxanthinifaciens CC-SAMT-1 TaxID=1454006 RepID=A0A0C5WEG0_9FLAO|nr:glycosyltransferase [Siansivirga zeaxanthinifaciens]AJR04617.1 glycosyltransferase [Siansivirga zeaxanthinifaciens CC-SAMT-1]